MDRRLKNILILDIETVSVSETYQRISEELKTHWERKVSFLRNEEGLSEEELFHARSGIYAEFGKVIVIGMGFYAEQDDQLTLRTRVLSGNDERGLLAQFCTILEKFEQEELRLCAHNGKEFDFPYLCRRMVVNGLTIPWALDLSGKKPWEVQHIDTMDLWKFGDRKNFTSLALLTEILGIPSSKNEMDGSMVNDTYYKDPEGLKKIARYCRGDVIATAQLFLKLNNLDLIPEERIIHTNE